MTTKFKLRSKQGLLILLSVAFLLVVGVGNAPGAKLPWYLSVLFGLVALGCGAHAMKLVDDAEKRHVLAHLAGRPTLSDKEFGERYFPPARAEIVAKLRQILTRHIAVDLSRMHPGDRFVDDLRMDALDSMAIVEFIIEIEKEFEISIPDSAAEKIITFAGVVDYVGQELKKKAAKQQGIDSLPA